jgi:hypothetical protein
VGPTTQPTIGPTLPPTPAPTTGPTVPAPSQRGGGGDTGGGRGAVAHLPPATAAPANANARPSPPPASAYQARWFDQSDYLTMQPGQIGQVTLRFRNTGTAPWIKGVPGRQANLGVHGEPTPYLYASADDFYRAVAADRGSAMSFETSALERVRVALERVSEMVAAGWPSADRTAIQSEEVVAPGELGTFTFSVRAPHEPGVYKLALRPVVDGTVWMEDSGAFILITTVADYHGRWVAQSAYPTVRAGSTSMPISLTFRNTGSLSWVRGVLGQQVNLGVTDAADAWQPFAANWPTGDRVAVQSESKVLPGQDATFTFQVRAPSAPGTYILRLRPVVDGTMWLEDQGVYVLITVVP